MDNNIKTLLKCKVCDSINYNNIFVIKEMFYGTMEKFDYFQCIECGCLQIKELPSDMSKYYPSFYYSLKSPNILSVVNVFGIYKYIKLKIKYMLYGKNILYNMLIKYFKYDIKFPVIYEFLKKSNMGYQVKILDVGCGIGQLLHEISIGGYKSLVGVDPYISNNLYYKNGIVVYKKYLEDINDKFDIIMLNHSFEHIPEPAITLRLLHRLLAPKGYVIIRIPVASSFAFEKYKENWVQIDAPRHLFLHTVNSMNLLANYTGFNIIRVQYDSTSFQFWGSEQYQLGIPLNAPNSYNINKRKSIFNKKDIIKYEMMAKELNENNNGDSACFYMISN